MMVKYREKPVTIEAFRWPSDNPPQWWIDALERDSEVERNAKEHDGLGGDKRHALIYTLEGIMRANEGDWIICGVNGELYPCKPDVFEKSYEGVL